MSRRPTWRRRCSRQGRLRCAGGGSFAGWRLGLTAGEGSSTGRRGIYSTRILTLRIHYFWGCFYFSHLFTYMLSFFLTFHLFPQSSPLSFLKSLNPLTHYFGGWLYFLPPSRISLFFLVFSLPFPLLPESPHIRFGNHLIFSTTHYLEEYLPPTRRRLGLTNGGGRSWDRWCRRGCGGCDISSPPESSLVAV